MGILKYIIIIIAVCLLSASSFTNEEDMVQIHVYNPYRISVGCEVKCDWDGKAKQYKYYKWIIVKGKKSYNLKISRKYNNCEVWPKILW